MTSDVCRVVRNPELRFAGREADNGFAAILWVVTGTRRMFNAMGIVGCLQAAANIWLVTAFSKGRGIHALQSATFEHYALFNAAAASVLISAGYLLFLYAFITEGRRYYDTLTEIRLAGAIHRSLVPEIKTAVNPFEFYGCSWPSGEVSGDLVDLAQYDHGWFAYVADVSGQGAGCHAFAMTRRSVRVCSVRVNLRAGSLQSDLFVSSVAAFRH